MEKINVAELLCNCPKGMELDCTMFENVTFVRVDMSREKFPIEIAVGGIRSKYLTKEGCFHDTTLLPESKCVIFPKGKTTWEGFQISFKDGDIAASKDGSFIGIVKYADENYIYTYCAINAVGNLTKNFPYYLLRFSTEEEKQKLFDAIKANGYKWNEETKTLEDLIEPKFKVGDKIEKCGYRFTIKEVKGDYYLTKCGNKIPFDNQGDFSLVPNKFNITTLKPFDKVLVRDCNTDKWNIDFFAYYREDRGDYQCMTFTKNQCIPYEGNEHLLGKNDDCDEYFNIWKK